MFVRRYANAMPFIVDLNNRSLIFQPENIISDVKLYVFIDLYLACMNVFYIIYILRSDAENCI